MGTWREAWLHDAAFRIDEPEVWRGVETQHKSATMLLVDSGDEHDLLEEMLESSKPPCPPLRHAPKHYLLTTPFRYTPQTASRFRPAGQRGLWYGARELRAACAEVAYWRMAFILDSAGLQQAKIISRHTFFQAHMVGLGMDLTSPPWVGASAYWTDGQDYTETHRLAHAAQAAGVEVIQYESVRSPGDTNFVVFTPDALSEPAKSIVASQQTWTCTATKDHTLVQRDGDGSQRFEWMR